MKRLTLALALLVANPAAAEHDLPTCMALAKAARKEGVVVFFSGKGCAPCERMKREVLPKVRPGKFLLMQSQDAELKKRYEVDEVPALVILDAEGKLVRKAVGFMPAEDFEAFLAGKQP